MSFKLRTADICGDCLSVFQSIGIPDSLLAQTVAIMETTRRQAINTGQFLPAEVSFSGWPFPVAITRHKAVQATNIAVVYQNIPFGIGGLKYVEEVAPSLKLTVAARIPAALAADVTAGRVPRQI